MSDIIKGSLIFLVIIIVMCLTAVIFLFEMNENDQKVKSNIIGSNYSAHIQESLSMEPLYITPTNQIIYLFTSENSNMFMVIEAKTNIVIAAFPISKLNKVIAYAVNQTMEFSKMLGKKASSPEEFSKIWDFESKRVMMALYPELVEPDTLLFH